MMRTKTWLFGVSSSLCFALFVMCCDGGDGTPSSTSTKSDPTGSTGIGTGTGTGPEPKPKPASGTRVSSTLALTEDDRTLWVVNQDADSVSVIDTTSRALLEEIPLAASAPKVDPVTQRFDPAVLPRALALVSSADAEKVYIAGESANAIFVVDARKRAKIATIPVPAAPVAVAAAKDGSAIYAISHEAAKVVRIDPEKDTVTASLDLTEHPFGASVSEDGSTLFVTHLLMDPGVSVIDLKSFSLTTKIPLADEKLPPGSDKRLPNGTARGLYTAVPRPGQKELWVPHLLLAVDTPQPELDFESTVFPTLSTIDVGAKKEGRRLLFRPLGVPGAKGAFSDSVSGPRDIAFTPDGKLALVALSQSEDVMVFDAESGNERALVRPLPSTMLEGIVVDHAGEHAYVDGRNSHNVAVLSIDPKNALSPVVLSGKPIERLKADPMPQELRLGQRLFYTANSAQFPITKNFWVACVSCHIEGGSDAVTWLFKEGPRDTPSNAGGPINTGFMLHQGLRNAMDQYDETIRIEQGGTYDRKQPAQKAELDALGAYVNFAIPFPQNPYRLPDGALSESQARGKKVFDKACIQCHDGPYYTDSGQGNAELDFQKAIVLHDVGTCQQDSDFPDKPGKNIAGNVHAACKFDTPTLRGVFATPPYFHDGSARTLRDVVDRLPYSADLPEADKNDLVEFLKAL